MPRLLLLVLFLFATGCPHSGSSSQTPGPDVPIEPDVPADPEGLWMGPSENSVEYRVLVLLACFDGAAPGSPCLTGFPVESNTQPYFTITSAEDAKKMIFDDRFPGPWKRETVNDYFREVSNDRMRITGEVRGYYHLNSPPPAQVSDLFAIQDELLALAKADGVDVDSYIGGDNLGRIVMGIPALLGYGGLAIGLNAFVVSIDSGLIAHELGHTLGLGHAHLVSCPDAFWSQQLLCTSPYYNEYGNFFSVMGATFGRGHYDVVQKRKLGWIDDSQILDIDQSGQYELTPLETREGLKALRMDFGFGQNFYIEFRRPLGFDKYANLLFFDWAPELMTIDGAFLEYALSYPYDTTLMEMGPGNGLLDPILPLGETHIEPSLGFQVTPLSITGTGTNARLLVDVQFFPPTMPLTLPLQTSGAQTPALAGPFPCGGSH